MFSHALEVYNQPPRFPQQHTHPNPHNIILPIPPPPTYSHTNLITWNVGSLHTSVPSLDIILNDKHNKPHLLFLLETKIHMEESRHLYRKPLPTISLQFLTTPYRQYKNQQKKNLPYIQSRAGTTKAIHKDLHSPNTTWVNALGNWRSSSSNCQKHVNSQLTRDFKKCWS